ncbi:MAG: putative sulfate exporter family transporter [Chloroflexi bacterium]|nr:putative sulfate exporter family transporter [Chloroflexota bacterium]
MKNLFKTEDWWSVWIGLFVFIVSMFTMVGADLLGWAVKTNTWINLSQATTAFSKAYAGLPGIVAVLLTYVFMLAITSVGAKVLGFDLGKFMVGFTILFWIGYGCWLLGNWAPIAVNTPTDMKKFGINFSLRLTAESGFIIALLVGLLIGYLFKGFAGFLKEATRPEWYIKTAIVILGSTLGVKAASATGLATAVMFRGLCAIVEAYLIYWALVYFVSRYFFKMSREWSAVLASGISVCGISAAIATAGAIRARAIVPVMVGSLVVIFAVVELLILPAFSAEVLHSQPMVAGAWMGLAVKTDGAAVASGAITDALIRGKAAELGINWQEGWMLMASTTTKLFIDMFIGIWAFVLAIVWTTVIDRKPGEKAAGGAEIWNRFPKFVIGYFFTFIIALVIGLSAPNLVSKLTLASGESDIFRVLFFVLTFLSIGLISDFAKLKEEGIGKLALVYLVCLFGFILWIGLAISFVFFHGLTPPPL